jgi:hypothetical protein
VVFLKNFLVEEHYHELFKVSVGFLETSNSALALASMKLMAGLLSCSELVTHLDLESLIILRCRLQASAHLSTSSEVSELAEKLMSLLAIS